jgi:hypothetical protein
MRLLVVALVLALSVGCTTTSPNMFSGKAVIQLDQGEFFITYVKIAMSYSVFKYQITQACVGNILPAETCDSLKTTDIQIQRIAEEINTSLQNPQYPFDMNKVQRFIDMVVVTMVKVGVKGISGGLIP